MPDLFNVKRGRIIGVSFPGVPCPKQSNLRVLHGPLYEGLYQACTNLETQDYTAANNFRDEYHLQDSVSKKTIEQELQIFMAPRSYSKTVSFGVGYYKETTVVMRPPKLDINIMGTILPYLMNPHLHYSTQPNMCLFVEPRQKHFMLIAWFQTRKV
ncbi:hypothetical protein TNCV_2430441 [Trichonephila clavipes]|nr:hypothetical protein TNCV_2430441 [Trichonephila clavipes]